MRQTFYCLLGSFPDLALAEIITVLTRFGEASPPVKLHDRLLAISLDHLEPVSLISVLGGTVKIYQPLATGGYQTIIESVSQDLIDREHGSFTVSRLGITLDELVLCQNIKSQVARSSRKIRFRLLKSLTDSAGILTKTQEYLIRQADGAEYEVSKTVAVQDIARWSQKDYDRPNINVRSGMLPPKIARCMVNIAIPSEKTSIHLYDPMCGEGTILVEALDLGCLIWGADINPTAVQNTQANLDWFSQSHISHQVGLASHVQKVFPADILQTQTVLPQSTLEVVVFEGFLGPPHLKTAKIDDYVKGLTKFYLGAFKNLLPLLKPQGYLVAAIPAFVAADRVKTLRHLVDSCEKLGYTQVHEPLWYYRPQAIIRRQILVWQKK